MTIGWCCSTSHELFYSIFRLLYIKWAYCNFALLFTDLLLSLNLPFAITKTNLVFFVVSLGNSDSKQKVAISSETQGCFTIVLWENIWWWEMEDLANDFMSIGSFRRRSLLVHLIHLVVVRSSIHAPGALSLHQLEYPRGNNLPLW